MIQLPEDIIIAFATCVKRQSTTITDLTSFMLVCRRWHQLGLRIFYSNIALSNSTLKPFATSFNALLYGKEVRSLTLCIDKDDGTHPEDLALFPASAISPSQNLRGFGHSKFPSANDTPSNEPTLAERLTSIVPLISQHLTHLVSFSFRLEESSHRSVARATIVAFLEALPESCQNLEFDTRGQDHREENEQVHVCATLRRILPQLQNARIRLGTMCSEMFGTREVSAALSENNEVEVSPAHQFEPIILPKLKSLIVNAGLPRGLQMQLCGLKDHTSGAKQPSWPLGLAWPNVIEALSNLTERQAKTFKDARIFAIIGTGSDHSTQACQTELRVDLVEKAAYAFPSIPLGRPFGPAVAHLLRLHDGTEVVMKELEHVEEVAEGQLWRDVAGGARLPAQVLEAEHSGLPSFAIGCVKQPMPMQPLNEWRERNPSEPLSMQLLNEEKVGRKLILAEKRTGAAYLDIRPVREITPEGWSRRNDSLLEPL